jgi:AraC family transcriptional regulator
LRITSDTHPIAYPVIRDPLIGCSPAIAAFCRILRQSQGMSKGVSKPDPKPTYRFSTYRRNLSAMEQIIDRALLWVQKWNTGGNTPAPKPETQRSNAMLNTSPSFGVVPSRSFGQHTSQCLAHNRALRPARPALIGCGEDQSTGISFRGVDIAPYRAVKRSGIEWGGMGVELVQAITQERVDHNFRSPLHLLAAYQQGIRRDGESSIDGVPRSTLRNVAKRLTFVPAGHHYREWYDPRTPTSITYFYFDPAALQVDPNECLVDILFTPRLLFEDTTIQSTAAKLRQAVEAPGGASQLYIEALGVVLIHELVRLNRSTAQSDTSVRGDLVRGGLAAWQQRIVTTYIEEHLSEQISLLTLARLARLSTFHFCRAFKQSFGVPPHRYHTNRRIEQAKAMLAERKHSVTEVGLTVGFSETSSFTAVFRKITGQTPSGYHRALG